MPEAHAIDIERCTECPFVSEHTPDDKRAACTHPVQLIVAVTTVRPFEAPPRGCPIRHTMTLLRVTTRRPGLRMVK